MASPAGDLFPCLDHRTAAVLTLKFRSGSVGVQRKTSQPPCTRTVFEIWRHNLQIKFDSNFFWQNNMNSGREIMPPKPSNLVLHSKGCCNCMGLVESVESAAMRKTPSAHQARIWNRRMLECRLAMGAWLQRGLWVAGSYNLGYTSDSCCQR